MRKMKPLIVVMALFCLLQPLKMLGQTPEQQNLKKYWENRDRLRKYFLKIGAGQGESIPATSRYRKHNSLKWGDATSYLGYYIAVLASEYRLLSDAGQPTTGTANELYYAINAINRLDLNAEVFYADKLLQESKSQNLNGWFLRDDVSSNFWQNWQDQAIVESDAQFYSVSTPIEYQRFSPANEPSQDQVIMLLLGFAFVKEFVGPNVIANPENNNTGFDLLAECQIITSRMMNNMQSFKRNAVNPFDDPAAITWQHIVNPVFDNISFFKLFYKKNYSFGNPDYGWQCTGNNDDYVWALAYPITQLAKKVTGNDYDFNYKVQFGGNDVNIILSAPYGTLEALTINNAWVNNGEVAVSMLDLLTVAVSGNIQDWVFIANPTKEVTKGLIAAATGLTPNEVEQRASIAVNGGAAKMNLRLMLQALCATDVFMADGTDGIKVKSDALDGVGKQIYPLISRVFHNDQIPTSEILDIENILNGLSACEGPYAYNSDENYSFLNNLKGLNNWNKASMWLEPGVRDPDAYSFGNYNALDYMILYNLYHIANNRNLLNAKSRPVGFTYPQYTSEVICPCNSIYFPEINNSINSIDLETRKEIIIPPTINTLTNTITAEKYFFDYENIGINLERYMVKDLVVQGPGLLDLKEDVKVCGAARTYISTGDGPSGMVRVGDGNTKNAVLRYTPNTELHIQSGGILNIQNNSRTIIEEGATLRIYPGAIIQLNGENAVLEIRGKLDILAGATFKTTGTGHVLFNIQNADPSIAPFNIAGTSTSQIVFESTSNPKPLKFIVANGTTVNPQQSLQMFKIDGVKGIIGQNAEIFLGSEFQIQNSYIEGYESFGFTFTTLNFTPNIHHNTFSGGHRALAFIGNDKGRDIKIHYNTFQTILNTIILYDHSAHIAGNSFEDNCGGVFAGATLTNIPPRQGGLFKGKLRMELNRFENSSALEIHGAYYPSIIYGGNVAHYTPTSSKPTRTDWTIASEKAHATLKCNWFENQGEAVYHGMSGNLNMSTQRQSYYALGSGGAYVTGGNNFFKTNLRSIVINSQNSQDPFSFATYDINQGQNSFTAIPSNSRTSLIVDRRWNMQSMNYTLNSSGNLEINGNFWTPTLSTSNYSAGFPSNVIEKNYYISNHFNIYEFQSPDFIVGTNTVVSQTCPIAVWDDAISDPANFNPLSGVAFGFNYGSVEPVKVYFDRPFGLGGQGYDYPPTTVTTGTYAGQSYGNAFNAALTGMTVQTTDVNNNTYYVPNPTGMLNMASLLISTANRNTTKEVAIYSFAYKAYLQCLARAAALDVFEGSVTAQNTQINAALAVFNAIESNNQQFASPMPVRYYQTRFSVGIDKLHLYRLFDRYTDAQSVLASLAGFAQTKEMVTVDYLSCHVENERRLFANEISWVEYRNNLENCGMLYGSETLISSTDTIGWGDTSQTSGGSSSTPSLAYTIAPNPATAQTSVIIDMNVDATVTITVFNKFGQQVVATQSLGTLLTGSQTTAIVTLGGLPADTYNMVVYADGVPYVQHFIKLTE